MKNVRAVLSMILVLSAGAAFAHHTPQHERAAHRAEALKMVERLGGTVTKVEKAVTKVDLHKSAVTDADLAMLASLDELQELDLRSTKVSDAAVTRLRAALPNLRIRKN
jgi:hypothetical protein